MDYKLITNIKVEGIDYSDYPDFCDAYIASADYDGVPMSEDQLEELNENGQFVYDAVINHIY